MRWAAGDWRRMLALVALVVLSGCRAFHDPHREFVSLYDVGDATAALQVIDRLAETRKAEPHVLAMDRAVLKLMSGQADDAVRELEILRRDLKYLSQQDVSEQIRSALKDDNAVAWSGRDFERRMVGNLQLLSGIVRNDSDVYALATRSMSDVHQQQLQAGVADQPVPDAVDGNGEGSGDPIVPKPVIPPADRFTAYLAAAVHSECMQDADLTDRLILQASHLESGPGGNKEMFQRLGTRTSRGSGTLQVITFSGRVTSWEPEKVLPTTAALLIADRILSAVGDHTLPATVSAVQIARPALPHAPSTLRTRVVLGPEHSSTSVVLVDLNENAWASYENDRDDQIARAIVRRILKKGAVYTLKNSMSVTKDSGADVLLNLAGGVWEALEKPDLRHCELLPSAIELAQLELPAGEHHVTLQVVPSNGISNHHVAQQIQMPVTIEDGRNTFVVCFRPRENLLGIQAN